jgi:hypothetical protein
MSAQAQSEFIRWVSDSQQSFLYTWEMGWLVAWP